MKLDFMPSNANKSNSKLAKLAKTQDMPKTIVFESPKIQ
jgi:hypothetical protein